jgi:Carboxypeptidase regulatory-like domain
MLIRVPSVANYQEAGPMRSIRHPLARAIIRITALGAIVAGGAARADDKPAADAKAKAPATEQGPAAAGATAKQASKPSAGVHVENQRTFELTVVGPDAKPLVGIAVECRGRPKLKDEQITTGEFVRRTNYGSLLKTDSKGRLALKLPPKMENFDFFIESPGYAPYWAGWNSETFTETIPPALTAELDPAWSVGGIVVDGDGKPVQGATLRPSIEFKKRPGITTQLQTGKEVKSDADGKWHFDCVPASMPDVQFEIHHPQFKPVWRTLTRAEFGIAPDMAPAAKIALDPGLTLTGTVTDESGNPIAGARIRAKFSNDVREAKSGSDGIYRLSGCDHVTARIVAWAKGCATDMQELRVEPDMKPVEFQMKPGGTVRIRVVDSQGNPVPKARIFFQRWRGEFYQYFEFDIVSEYADEHDIWEWHEAPLDEFKADICPRGVEAMPLSKQSLIARPEEYVFKLPPPLVISGKVVDAESKKPIGKFQVVWGIRDADSHMTWVRTRILTAHDGQYEFRPNYDYFANLIRIEAEGYLPAVSRAVTNDEGNVTIDFELKKGKNVAATVLLPDGTSANKAKVALGVAGSQIEIKNGDLDDSSTYCERRATDAAGHFSFPPQEGDFQLIITHPAGFAHVKKSGDDMRPTIKLTPWSKVEGTFRIGSKRTANVPITINIQGSDEYGNKVPHIFTFHDVTSGPDGRFVFERVFPGRGWIGRRIMLTVNDGAADVTSSCMMRAEFPAGETTHLDVGGTGRAVVGQLRPPESCDGRVPWNFALVNLQFDKTSARLGANILPAVPGLEERVMANLAEMQSITATVDREGRFRIDDVPAGVYLLDASFQSRDRTLGSVRAYHIAVPSADAKSSDKPIDLGTLQLK